MKIGYWIATVLTAFVFVSGGIVYLLRLPFAAQGVELLGYPAYFVPWLGAWKLAGGLTVLAPGAPRLKEWAYAGMVFDLSSASASHFATHAPAAKAIVPLVILVVVFASWAMRPSSRRLTA